MIHYNLNSFQLICMKQLEYSSCIYKYEMLHKGFRKTENTKKMFTLTFFFFFLNLTISSLF